MTATEPRPEPAAPEEGSGQASEHAPADATPAASAATAPLVRRVQPEQAREDTDAAWGEYPDSNDDRLDRDRPPHWADF